MKKFRNVVAAVMAALMVVGMSSTALAATQNGDVLVDDSGNVEIVIYDTTTSQAVDSITVSAEEAFTLEWIDGWGMAAVITEDYANTIITTGYECIADNVLTDSVLSMYSGVQSGVTYVWLNQDEIPASTFKLEVQPTSTSTETDAATDTTTTTTTATTETTETVEEEPADPNEYIEDVISKIAIASVDGTGVAKITNLTSLSIDVMKALEEYNVALEMTFIYSGTEYTLTIPAGKAVVDENIQWYGPMWLYAHYGQGTTTTTTTSGSTYTVVSGDTLSLIAAEHDMSLAELAAKNPQITNINLIFPGQVINL
ncbi:MAG: LysM peptidoglycan-binding domain-containing protein [Lachnospiraceae bacterium]|nr:LysM peptidoglycan-binding domain-containing protein [Lachnospiraceae bacterium]